MIEEKDLITQNIGENISYYRKQFNLTQLELAEKLNYSDKSISKWERKEGVPDIYVIAELSKFFGISIDTLVKKRKVPTPLFKRQQSIALFYALIVWLVVTIGFATLTVFKVNYPAWHLFIFAIPASTLILFIFNVSWKNIRWTYFYLTIFIWTLAFSFNIGFPSVESYISYIVATPIYIFSCYAIFLTLLHKKKINQ